MPNHVHMLLICEQITNNDRDIVGTPSWGVRIMIAQWLMIISKDRPRACPYKYIMMIMFDHHCDLLFEYLNQILQNISNNLELKYHTETPLHDNQDTMIISLGTKKNIIKSSTIFRPIDRIEIMIVSINNNSLELVSFLVRV
jgi:hypothetical protein